MPKLKSQSSSQKRRGLRWQSQRKQLDGTKNIHDTAFYIYTKNPTARWVARFRMIRYSSEGKVFFGPSAKGLCSRCSLNLLQRNKLILRGATVGGLSLPKVLKNMTNHMFSTRYGLLQGASASGWKFLPWQRHTR
jgi:hypothetical protein